MSDAIFYVVLALAVFWVARNWWKFRQVCKLIPEHLQNGAVVIDVRTPGEFSAGHFAGSQNIPLDKIGSQFSTIPKDQTVLICCASGARSGMAAKILKSKGFSKVVNVGPWQNLTRHSCQ